MKILIVNNDYNKFIKLYGVDMLSIYNKQPAFLRVLRGIHRRSHLPYFHIWHKKEWWKICKEYDLIVLHDSSAELLYFSERIEQNVKESAKLILYFWNPIQPFANKLHLFSNRWLLTSFSMLDSEKYGLHYVGTFFCANQLNFLHDNNEIKQEIYFVGQEKGRKKILKSFQNEMTTLGIKTLFQIVNNKKSVLNKTYSKPILYQDVLKNDFQSKAILEILQTNQDGLSLRSLESLFMRKKLITNNQNIIKYNFYCPQNIFILGVDDINSMKSFINSPYNQIPESIINDYEFSFWLKRLNDIV